MTREQVPALKKVPPHHGSTPLSPKTKKKVSLREPEPEYSSYASLEEMYNHHEAMSPRSPRGAHGHDDDDDSGGGHHSSKNGGHNNNSKNGGHNKNISGKHGKPLALVKRTPHFIDGKGLGIPSATREDGEEDGFISHHKSKTFFKKMQPLAVFMGGWAYNVPMLVGTIFGLFSEDIRVAAVPVKADTAWDVLTFLCFLLFSVDLVLSSLSTKKYFLRLFFWLDLLALLSLVPAIGFFGVGNSLGAFSVAKAGRAARAGTRSGRLVRIFKLFKLTRKREVGVGPEDEDPAKATNPSEIGRRLSDKTTMKLVVIVMLMVALIPLLQVNDDITSKPTYALAALVNGYELPPVAPAPKTAARLAWEGGSLAFYLADAGPNLIRLEINGEVLATFPARLDKLRQPTDLLDVAVHKPPAPYEARATLNNRAYTRAAAVYSLGLTVFLVALLSVGNYFFQRDSTQLVIKPIERMVTFIKNLAENPMGFTGAAGGRKRKSKKKQKNKKSELDLLEASLAKIGGLLQIGFGEAGANIISKNLAMGGALNAMQPGQKVEAVFGFCDIRQFTDTTECLLEDVLLFVNTIAKIVHEACSDNYGAPNKNIGDAFLLVWRLPDEGPGGAAGAADDWSDYSDGGADGFLKLSDRKKHTVLNKLADGALRSFLRVIEEIETSETLKELMKRDSVRKRLGDDYMVKMGFGLHVGWGIEGAIGSQRKVDCSYLSPHVNISARLESATKAFGKLLLLSEAFVSALSPEVAASCRKLDRVTVKGSNEPMILYTFDVHVPRDGSGSYRSYREYSKLYHAAYDKYIAGKWGEAARGFERCLEQWPDDEPPKLLLWYMARYNMRAPGSWKHYRVLDEK
jgi:class 3 adenylate cyclase